MTSRRKNEQRECFVVDDLDRVFDSLLFCCVRESKNDFALVDVFDCDDGFKDFHRAF
jgi:hypothetical protein